jgi:hypothetical protein
MSFGVDLRWHLCDINLTFEKMTVKFFTKSSSAISIMKNFVVTLCDYVNIFLKEFLCILLVLVGDRVWMLVHFFLRDGSHLLGASYIYEDSKLNLGSHKSLQRENE